MSVYSEFNFPAISMAAKRNIYWIIGVLLIPNIGFQAVDTSGMTKNESFSIYAVRLLLLLCYLFCLFRFGFPSCTDNKSNKAHRWIVRLAYIEIVCIWLSWVLGIHQGFFGVYHCISRTAIILCVARCAYYATSELVIEYIFHVTCIWVARYAIFLLVVSAMVASMFPSIGLMDASASRGSRLGGYFVHPNFLSAFFSLGILSLVYLKEIMVLGVRLRWAPVSVFFVIGIYATQSRTSAISLCVCLLIFASVVLFNRFSIRSGFVKGLFFTSIALIGMGISKIVEDVDGGTVSDRYEIYQTAINGFFSSPLVGVGFIEGVRQYMNENCSIANRLSVSHCHNIVLDCLLSRGLILSGPFLTLLISSVLFSLRRVLGRQTSNNRGMLYLALSILFVLIHGMSEGSAAGVCPSPTGVLFYLFSMLAFCYLLLTRKRA